MSPRVGLSKDEKARLRLGMARIIFEKKWEVKKDFLTFPGSDAMFFPVFLPVALIPLEAG